MEEKGFQPGVESVVQSFGKMPTAANLSRRIIERRLIS